MIAVKIVPNTDWKTAELGRIEISGQSESRTDSLNKLFKERLSVSGIAVVDLSLGKIIGLRGDTMNAERDGHPW